jgi:hypothetical protein
MAFVGAGTLIRTVVKTVTFTGAANLGQAATAVTVFTVTGMITVVKITARCTTDLVPAVAGATVALGTVATPLLFITTTTSADVDSPDVWSQAAPTLRSIIIPTIMKDTLVNGENIIITNATQDTSGGVLDIILTYTAETAGALAV